MLPKFPHLSRESKVYLPHHHAHNSCSHFTVCTKSKLFILSSSAPVIKVIIPLLLWATVLPALIILACPAAVSHVLCSYVELCAPVAEEDRTRYMWVFWFSCSVAFHLPRLHILFYLFTILFPCFKSVLSLI
jgi:hypothetical protein